MVEQEKAPASPEPYPAFTCQDCGTKVIGYCERCARQRDYEQRQYR